MTAATDVTAPSRGVQKSDATRISSRHPVLVRFIIVLVGAIAVDLMVHDVAYLASWPLWGDEAWVVLSKLFPLSDLPALTSSTPIGWNLLVRLFAPFGDQGGRILVQMFSIAATVTAFYIGRRSPVVPRGAMADLSGVVLAAAIALCPTILLRVDIKQYTSDAFFALFVLLLLMKARESLFGQAPVHRARRDLVVLTLVCFFGLLFSFAVLFAGMAAFAGLLLEALIHRRHRLRILICGLLAGVGIVIFYVAFYARGNNSALHDFWLSWYPSPSSLLPFIQSHFTAVAPYATFTTVRVVVPLVALAFVMLVVRRAWGIAVFLPVIFATMLSLGVLKLYPVLDARTSTYFLIISSVYAAWGAFWLIGTLASLVSTRLVRGRGVVVAATIAAAIVVVGVIGTSAKDIRAHPLPNYDTTNQSAYVEKHIKPGDLVLFNNLAGYQLSLSWKRDAPSWCPTGATWTGYWICYPDQPQVVGFSTLNEAYRMIDDHFVQHPGTKVWLIRSSVFVEYAEMEQELPKGYDYQVIPLPIQPLGVVTGLKR